MAQQSCGLWISLCCPTPALNGQVKALSPSQHHTGAASAATRFLNELIQSSCLILNSASLQWLPRARSQIQKSQARIKDFFNISLFSKQPRTLPPEPVPNDISVLHREYGFLQFGPFALLTQVVFILHCRSFLGTQTLRPGSHICICGLSRQLGLGFGCSC